MVKFQYINENFLNKSQFLKIRGGTLLNLSLLNVSHDTEIYFFYIKIIIRVHF